MRWGRTPDLKIAEWVSNTEIVSRNCWWHDYTGGVTLGEMRKMGKIQQGGLTMEFVPHSALEEKLVKASREMTASEWSGRMRMGRDWLHQETTAGWAVEGPTQAEKKNKTHPWQKRSRVTFHACIVCKSYSWNVLRQDVNIRHVAKILFWFCSSLAGSCRRHPLTSRWSGVSRGRRRAGVWTCRLIETDPRRRSLVEPEATRGSGKPSFVQARMTLPPLPWLSMLIEEAWPR